MGLFEDVFSQIMEGERYHSPKVKNQQYRDKSKYKPDARVIDGECEVIGNVELVKLEGKE